MVRGLYAAAAGISVQMQRQDVYAANLANVSTTGYRRSSIAQQSFPADLALLPTTATERGGEPPQGTLTGGLSVSPGSLDLTPGPIIQTSSDFDLAVSGSGFFCVRSPQGEAYTRDGRFSLDTDGVVVNPSGYPLLGTRGQLRITTGQMRVDSQGAVYDGDQLVDSLRIVEFDTPVALTKLGDGLIVGAAPRVATGYEIVQGAVEGSNVQAVTELQRMMAGMRLYEANVRALQTQDETIGSLLREAVG